jgi:phosphoglycerol transferase MdoB-like AlkP superfamily enzyme
MPNARAFGVLTLAVLGLVLAPQLAAAPRDLAWTVVSQQTPSFLWTGRRSTVRIQLRNTGRTTWSEAAGDHLSYHWLASDGTMVEHDGERTSFARPVCPGETVALTACVRAPASAGRWVLEWEMVREQIAWYGPPAGAPPLRIRVFVVWRCVVLTVGFALLTAVMVVAARKWRRRAGTQFWLAVESAPVVWTWLGVGLATVTFSEVTAQQLWSGGGVLAASAAALLATPVALLPGRWRGIAAGGVVGAVNLLAFADVLHLRFFGTVVPVVAMAAAGQLGEIGGSIHALMHPIDGWLLVGLSVGLLFALLWPRRRRDEGVPATARRLAWAGVTAAALAASVPAGLALRAGMSDHVVSEQLFSHGVLLGRWGLVNVHLFDALRTYREWVRRDMPEPGERRRVQAFFAARAADQMRPVPGFGVARGDNLILIQVESLQQWLIGARVGGAEITPFLNALRSRALYFPFVFDQTGEGRSSDGEFGVLNSQHALDRGALAFRFPYDHFVALPSVLRQHGYATLSAHPFDRGFWNRGVLHPRLGFERMVFRRELGPGETIGWGLADGVFFQRIAGTLAGERQPYFAFLITLGLHHPFDLFPNCHKVLDVGPLEDTPLGNYIHAMHYFDASLAAFIATLEQSGGLAHTVVALYGDHESGLDVDAPLLALAGEKGWDPSVLVRLRRVPFFVLLPGSPLAGDVPAIGGQVDIAPTLLALLGVPAPACFVGRPLDPGRASFVVLNEGSAVGDGREFVAEGPAVPVEGACFAWPSGERRPFAECAGIKQRGEEELAASRFVVVHDLAAEFAAPAAP